MFLHRWDSSVTWPEFQHFTGSAGMCDPTDLSRSCCVPKASNSPGKNSDNKIRSLWGNSYLESWMLSRDGQDAFPSPLTRYLGIEPPKKPLFSLKIWNFTDTSARSGKFCTQELRGGPWMEFNTLVLFGKNPSKNGFVPSQVSLAQQSRGFQVFSCVRRSQTHGKGHGMRALQALGSSDLEQGSQHFTKQKPFPLSITSSNFTAPWNPIGFFHGSSAL